MKVTLEGGDLAEPLRVIVRLSRRNLQTLLMKLDEAESARTLFRAMDDDTLLVVVAEEDEQHYEGREPGKVHPREEEKLKEAA